MSAAENNDGLMPPAIETIVGEDGRCGTTVYRYSQLLSEERKALIRQLLPNATFVTRMRIATGGAGEDGTARREMFSEVFDNSMAETRLSRRVK